MDVQWLSRITIFEMTNFSGLSLRSQDIFCNGWLGGEQKRRKEENRRQFLRFRSKIYFAMAGALALLRNITEPVGPLPGAHSSIPLNGKQIHHNHSIVIIIDLLGTTP